MSERVSGREGAGISLAGRTVLVTGAGGNLGGAIARRLGGAGARVVLAGRVATGALEGLAREMPGEAHVVVSDLDDGPEGCERLVADAAAAAGALSGLVNCAARQDVAALAETDAAMFAALMGTNSALPLWLMRAFAAQAGAGASIVNIASIEAARPLASHGAYAASKAALLSLTRSAAVEFGPHGVRVNAVSPGLIARPGIERDWPEGVARWRDASPQGRLVAAPEVAEAVLFLLSDAARAVNGAEIVVDGGASATAGW